MSHTESETQFSNSNHGLSLEEAIPFISNSFPHFRPYTLLFHLRHLRNLWTILFGCGYAALGSL